MLTYQDKCDAIIVGILNNIPKASKHNDTEFSETVHILISAHAKRYFTDSKEFEVRLTRGLLDGKQAYFMKHYIFSTAEFGASGTLAMGRRIVKYATLESWLRYLVMSLGVYKDVMCIIGITCSSDGTDYIHMF